MMRKAVPSLDAPFIRVSNLEFSFKTDPQTPVLKIESFEIEKGEKVFLYGPSGCGKSTFLEILAGVLPANHGEVLVNGFRLGRQSAAERDQFRAKNVGYIFQNFNLLPYLNVYENIVLPFHFNGQIKSAREIRSEAERLCDELGILHLIGRSTQRLSVGQQQRVAVARALVGRPGLILADEPTSALDFDHREKFLNLLFKICDQHNITLLFVSHDHSVMSEFDRAVHFSQLNQSACVKDGP